MRSARKNSRAPYLSARIGTTVDIREAKGGATHHRIVRDAAAPEGQATAEYAFILAFVAAVAVAGYQLFGAAVVHMFEAVVNAF